ncbi:CHAT domain-containing protein [Lactarius akahatsu]|uniref:CHAT domain-containing protein n=1 Tax=Lactarius akahatsu TaxID=416441 RepID=A0AAD4LE62_9AGAM|nr:CHAT domain-containing protein [Lactarius akahatsu]
MRHELSHQKGDLDKSIAHFTEAILLPFQRDRDVVNDFFQLASLLSSRFWVYKQPEDVKSSLKYFRFLRINFHPFDAFDILHYQLTSRLIRALAHNLKLGFGDVTQDMEEIAALSHELLTSDTSGSSRGELKKAIAAFTLAVTSTLARDDSTQQPSERVQVLREATTIMPDEEHDISLVLVRCHTTRFQRTLAINEYEEAIAIADKIVNAYCPGDDLTPTHVQEIAIDLIAELVSFRINSSTDPVYLGDAIHRIRNLLRISSSDRRRATLTFLLSALEQQRTSYFGIATSSMTVPFDISNLSDSILSDRSRALLQVGKKPDGDPQSLLVRSIGDLRSLLASIYNDQITDIEAAVECGRALLPPPDHQFSHMPTVFFADILFEAYQRTKKLDYLNDAITVYRDHIRNGSGYKKTHFMAVYGLVCALIWRFKSYPRRQDDIDEAMQFYAILADHEYVEVFNRLYFSCSWAHRSRLHAHPSTPTAYEKAMSLLQGTLVFSPTLQTQHFRLADLPGGPEGLPSRLPSDYASYLIKMGQYKRAIETLERGRALLWSEMRGLRTSTDQIRAVNPALSDEFTAINRQLESHMDLSLSLTNPNGAQTSSFSSKTYLLPSSPTPSDFRDRANRLKDQLLRVRKEKGPGSEDYSLTLGSVLADLYELVGRPVIERLRQLQVPDKSRVWLCPTSAFCSLPLHAMGPIPSDDGDGSYFMDLYITSYTPTLSALIESRKPGSQSDASDKPSLLVVAQPETLPGTLAEIDVLKAVGSLVTTLVSEKATLTTVRSRLRDHRFVHFACHGLLETGKPFDASFQLHGDNLTLLEIVRSYLPAAEFAFLSACHTAELTDESIADEGLHLAAAMQFCGFRSVVGTMWAMADTGRRRPFQTFLQVDFLGQGRAERNAPLRKSAVKKLRKKRGITLERWVNFVHYGA